MARRSIVIVHGIRPTAWTTEEWTPESGSKKSTSWVTGELGFTSGRALHFHYDITTAMPERPDVFYRGGIEREAQKLIDGLLNARQEFDVEMKNQDYSNVSLLPELLQLIRICVLTCRRLVRRWQTESRAIIFVAHDIGGIIVKKVRRISFVFFFSAILNGPPVDPSTCMTCSDYLVF